MHKDDVSIEGDNDVAGKLEAQRKRNQAMKNLPVFPRYLGGRPVFVMRNVYKQRL